MKTAGQIAIGLVILLVGVSVAFYLGYGARTVSTAPVQPEEISGSIEAEATDVNV